MTKYNVAVVGVGGQGVLTLGSAIGWAAILSGLDVTVSEIHGLSQRGGSLLVQVRIGGGPPIIPRGMADLILCLEAIECARYSALAGRHTVVVLNNFLWPPPLSKHPTLGEIARELGKSVRALHAVDADSRAAEAAGSPIYSNTYLLGYALGADERFGGLINVDAAAKAMAYLFRGKALEANLKVLKLGYEEARCLREPERPR